MFVIYLYIGSAARFNFVNFFGTKSQPKRMVNIPSDWLCYFVGIIYRFAMYISRLFCPCSFLGENVPDRLGTVLRAWTLSTDLTRVSEMRISLPAYPRTARRSPFDAKRIKRFIKNPLV
ncbi:hypothetical protein GYMLUDRAFT_706352 [Collybiopsis luxurians FD-317 M1]|uniref:Uncharacterized protein n=1 Tax=Collybiopsis luxurians FD-317 M1 TaxID=944289 RepID=A0A0D0BS32_9AGAR|nr:hypothetical protein GYMLUDRAFT_706352 [Collybiopsis luxurians FD-317 M1]